MLAGAQPCPGWGSASPRVPVGAWCPHKDSLVLPVPGCGCHSPFFGGGADLHQADVHQWAMSLCFAKYCSMWPGSSAQQPEAQGAGAGISCCTLAFQPGTPAWHHFAPSQHQTLDGFVQHQCIGSQSLAKAKLHPSPKSDFFLADSSLSCAINIWGMALVSTTCNVNGTEPCYWEIIYVDNHTLALPWILFSVNALAFVLLCQSFFQSQQSISSISLSLKNKASVVEGLLFLVWTHAILM